MRNQKEVQIKIDEKTTRMFIVLEVRPLDVRRMLQQADLSGSLLDLAQKYLPLFTDATIDDLEALYPSDIEKLYEAWKEVNRPLLRAAQALNLGPLREKLIGSLVNDLIAFAASVLQTVTPASGTTAGASSLPPSNSAPGAATSD